MPFEQLRRDMPHVWARNEAQADDTFAWPGGETYAEFLARIVAGLDRAAAAYAPRRVAVVTHAGVISLFRNRPASVWSVDRPAPFTATEVEWRHGGPAPFSPSISQIGTEERRRTAHDPHPRKQCPLRVVARGGRGRREPVPGWTSQWSTVVPVSEPAQRRDYACEVTQPAPVLLS